MGANPSKTRQIPCPPGVKPGDKIQRQTGLQLLTKILLKFRRFKNLKRSKEIKYYI